MMRQPRYRDSFWDTDINSSRGYEELHTRMKEGRKLCGEIESYFKQRAKIENTYAKDLVKLVDNCKLKAEMGSLEYTWAEVKKETNRIAQSHERAGADFDKLAQELASFAEEQKRRVKVHEDNVQKIHALLKSVYSKTMNQEKVFHNKSDDYERSRDAVKFSENNYHQVNPKELDKQRSRESKAKEEMEKNDTQYKNLIEEVTKTKANFEKEMESLCEVFQELDEKRIDHLRDSLWKCANLDSRVCVEHDECSERSRRCIESCDIDGDIQEFIRNHKTGKDRPPSILYRPHKTSLSTFDSKSNKNDPVYSEIELR